MTIKNGVLTLFATLLIVFTASGQAYNFNGMAAMPGNISPTKPTDKINLSKQIIKLNHFDTMASYSVLYEFKNLSNEYVSIDAVLPIDIYFTDFRPDKRARVLNDMAKVFPDVFDVPLPFADISQQIMDKFGRRKLKYAFGHAIRD